MFQVFSYTPVDDDKDILLDDAKGAGPFTPTATNAGDNLAHLISIDSGANLSGITFTLTGTDADGKTQTEAVTGPNATTVYSTKHFLTVTSVAVSSTTGASTFDLGVKDECVSRSIPLNYFITPFNVSLGVDISGTISYTIQHTFDDVYSQATAIAQQTWFNHSSLASLTADNDSNYAFPCRACRIKVNSLTSGATVKLTIGQGGI